MTNKELFQRLNAGDTSAREKIIMKNQPLVMVVVKRYQREEDPVYWTEDMLSIGNIGLIKAVDGYKIELGYAFSTFAVRCITNEILMAFRIINRDVQVSSLNMRIDEDNDGEWMDLLVDEDGQPEKIVSDRDMVIRGIRAIRKLNDREKIAMAELINGQGEALQREIGKKIGITQSACSKMIRRAQQKLVKECGYTM